MNENHMDMISELPSQEVLDKMSFRTTLGRSLKKMSLKDNLLEELMVDVSAYRAVSRGILVNSGIPNVRFKSDDSIERKYAKVIKNSLRFSQCFNDMIGIRLRFEEYSQEFPSYCSLQIYRARDWTQVA